MHLKDANGKQGRCFTMKECDESSLCDNSNETSSLDDLKGKCLKNNTCVAFLIFYVTSSTIFASVGRVLKC